MSAYERLLEQGYTDEQIEAIMSLGGMQEESKYIGEKVGRAEREADFPMAQGRQVGGTFVAAHPLEHLVRALRMRQGREKLEQYGGERQDLLQRQKEARLNFLRNQGMSPSPMGGGVPYSARGLRGV